MKSWFVAAAALALVLPRATSGPSIGIFGSNDCGSCDLTIAPGETRPIFISVVGEADGGVNAASLRVAGLPDGWLVSSTPSPITNLAQGDPFGPGGAVINFPVPQL